MYVMYVKKQINQRSVNPLQLLWLSVFHLALMLLVNLPIADLIHSKGNKFVTNVKINARGYNGA